jgi:alpha-1,6-mannosyltransferase
LLVGSSMPTTVPGNVTVIDEFCPAAQVARLMASADALLHAGDQETFGLVILEAMASGIPVVAVAAGAFQEIVTEQCGLLCAPNDSMAMANAVRELFSSGSAVRGKQARNHVEQHYAWDTVVNSLLGHYHAVLGSPLPLAANG